jgi:hypothetical protein
VLTLVAAPTVLATGNQRPNCHFDERPLVDHLWVAQPDDPEPKSAQGEVTRPIGVKRGGALMPLASVRLNHEPVSEQKIDPPHTGDRDLRPDSHPEP